MGLSTIMRECCCHIHQKHAGTCPPDFDPKKLEPRNFDYRNPHEMGFPKMGGGTPIAGWFFVRKNPNLKWMMIQGNPGYPHFWNPPNIVSTCAKCLRGKWSELLPFPHLRSRRNLPRELGHQLNGWMSKDWRSPWVPIFVPPVLSFNGKSQNTYIHIIYIYYIIIYIYIYIYPLLDDICIEAFNCLLDGHVQCISSFILEPSGMDSDGRLLHADLRRRKVRKTALFSVLGFTIL